MASNDFFLEPDDAQTLGDIKYMRKSVKIRRTFPKTLKNPEGFALEKEFSATEGKNVSPNNGTADSAPASTFTSTPTFNPSTTSTSAPKPAPPTGSKPQERQKRSSDLDMFRNMAKNIKKGK